MKYVLDASVALKWVLSEPESDKAIRVRDDYLHQVCDLIAPDVFPIEIAHVLAKAERRGLIQNGSQKLVDVLLNQPLLYPYRPLLAEAYDLASQFRIGVYDCLYLALAEQEQCELITADSRLFNATKLPYVKLLSSLP